MENLHYLTDLSKLSQYVGNRISDVQGGGGNTSVKYENFMAVKASGFALKDLTANEGYAILNNKAFLSFLDKGRLEEDNFETTLSNFLISEKYNRPSMEAGLHAILNYKYVAHTHSAYVNVFTCSKQGKEVLKKYFPNSLWIEYSTPGLDLFRKVRSSLKKCDANPNIIFLQNHGVFICSNDYSELIDINNTINNFLVEKFNLPIFNLNDCNYEETLEELLFPDQAIYLDNIGKLPYSSLSTAAKETMGVVNYLMRSIESLGFSPNFLSYDEKNKLLNLESEKYRKKLEK